MLCFSIVKTGSHFFLIAVADEELKSCGPDKRHVDSNHEPGGFRFGGKGAKDPVQRSGDVKMIYHGVEMIGNVLIFPAGNEYLVATLSEKCEEIFTLRHSVIVQQAFITAHSRAETSGQDQAVEVKMVVGCVPDLLNVLFP